VEPDDGEQAVQTLPQTPPAAMTTPSKEFGSLLFTPRTGAIGAHTRRPQRLRRALC